jgi:hypothetical protein
MADMIQGVLEALTFTAILMVGSVIISVVSLGIGEWIVRRWPGE